ncbi:MAG: 4'-phosphopantetheinyl transferase family protein [Brevibacterium aurantiacum]
MITLQRCDNGVVLAYTDTEWDVGEVIEEEVALVRDAVPSRRAEFLTVRHCARQALQTFGHGPRAILPGPDRAPIWPVGVHGSLTHCDGMRAAAVVSADDTRSIGLDAEPWKPLPEDILDLVASPKEQTRLGARFLSSVGGRLIFSAKEAAFKAMHSLGTTVMEPHGLSVDLDAASIVENQSAKGTFAVTQVDTDLRVRGVWARKAGILMTFVHVPAGPFSPDVAD